MDKQTQGEQTPDEERDAAQAGAAAGIAEGEETGSQPAGDGEELRESEVTEGDALSDRED